MVVQLQLMRWTAEGAEDRYEPSEDLVATPPIMTIRPGGVQTLRVGLTAGVDAQRERAYRLYAEEVPPPPVAGHQGLQVALRIGVPVFVEPARKAEPVLQWRATRSGDGSLNIQVSNRGDAHLRLIRLNARASDSGEVLGSTTVAQYLLPGKLSHIPLKTGSTVASRVVVSAETDKGALDVALDVEGQ